MRKFVAGLAIGLTFVAGMVFADSFSEVRVGSNGAAGGIKTASNGDLCIMGPNLSCDITINAQGNVTVHKQLNVVEDLEVKWNGQFGPCADGTVPNEPDGAINLCRNAADNDLGYIRLWQQDVEKGRLGLSYGKFSVMREASDSPGWVISPSGAMCMRDTETGNVTNKLSFVNGILTVGTC